MFNYIGADLALPRAHNSAAPLFWRNVRGRSVRYRLYGSEIAVHGANIFFLHIGIDVPLHWRDCVFGAVRSDAMLECLDELVFGPPPDAGSGVGCDVFRID